MSDRIHVVFVEPEIHWNTGNAGRTCLAVGAKLHLVGPLGFSLGEREVRRAGLDYWPKVDPKVWENWESFEPHLDGLGTPYFFTPDAEREYWDVEYSEPAVLLFGRESVGFTPSLRERYRDRSVRIPQLEGSIRSLNVSTCVGIAVYELLRRRRSSFSANTLASPSSIDTRGS
jgi:tRNA (cytidine/uridine-2'-O-)-methyltransferase